MGIFPLHKVDPMQHVGGSLVDEENVQQEIHELEGVHVLKIEFDALLLSLLWCMK